MPMPQKPGSRKTINKEAASVELRHCEAVISSWHTHCTVVSNWNCRIQFETGRRRDNAFRARRRFFCDTSDPLLHTSSPGGIRC
jgi:hypothetical protein